MKSWLLYSQLPVIVLLLGYSCRKEAKEPMVAKVEPIQVVSDTTQTIDFNQDIVPMLKARCSPCHFQGGKMYEKMPFDKPETIINHKAGVTKRFKEQDLEKLKAFLDKS